MRIMFVCTGNICRSPMGEALLRFELTQRRIDGVSVSSAGTWGQDGSVATSPATEVMRSRGIDLTTHRARTVTEVELADVDLIVVMAQHHERDSRLEPYGAKVRFIRELTELEPEDLPEGASPDERLGALLAATRPPYRRGLELDDPYGLPVAVYERTATTLQTNIKHLADLLFGKVG